MLDDVTHRVQVPRASSSRETLQPCGSRSIACTRARTLSGRHRGRTPSINQVAAFRFTDGSGRDAAAAGCQATAVRALNVVPAVNHLRLTG